MMAKALVALVAVLCLTSGTSAQDIDADILQFALNLEYLEANFYSCAAYGTPLDASLTGGGPVPSGCLKAKLSPGAQMFAEDIAKDEIAHVAFLRSALTTAGATPVAQPALDLSTPIGIAINLALNTSLTPPFQGDGSDVLFYLAAFIFEDVGATAYKGAASLITNPAYLTAAGGILATEAYHAGAIRTKLFAVIDEFQWPSGRTSGQIANAISRLRDAAAGTKVDAPIKGPNNIYVTGPVDKNSVLNSHSVSEVLKIVYLGGTSSGGFFPAGLNGAFKSA